MRTVTAALLATGCAVAIGVSAQPAEAATHPRVAWGITQVYWDQFHADVPRGHAVRVFVDKYNDIPASWPRFLGSPWVTLSIRPLPGPLFSGSLNRQLRRLIRSAPPHSQLAIWHEAGPANPRDYPPSVEKPWRLVRMEEYMQRLCRHSNVRFGSIIVGPANQLHAWIAPHLDWYSYDLYDGVRYRYRDGRLDVKALWSRMSADYKEYQLKSGRRHPVLTIAETNSPWNYQRAAWFTAMSRWFMGRHVTGRILTFWKPGHGLRQGKLSGPWPPTAPVIATLRKLAKRDW